MAWKLLQSSRPMSTINPSSSSPISLLNHSRSTIIINNSHHSLPSSSSSSSWSSSFWIQSTGKIKHKTPRISSSFSNPKLPTLPFILHCNLRSSGKLLHSRHFSVEAFQVLNFPPLLIFFFFLRYCGSVLIEVIMWMINYEWNWIVWELCLMGI